MTVFGSRDSGSRSGLGCRVKGMGCMAKEEGVQV